MAKLKDELQGLFNITNLGEPSKLVGLEFTCDQEWEMLTIQQTQYIKNLLEKYLMQDGNAVFTPLNPNMKLKFCKPSAELASQCGKYASLTGSLMYTTIGTHPDIIYAVNKLCSFNQNPDLVHWITAKHVLCYLQGTKEPGITYTKGSIKGELYGYTNASFISNHDLTLTSGNVFILNGGAIAWSLKKELSPMLSTTEAEFNSMACTKKDIIWLQNLYEKIRYEPKKTTILYDNNKYAITIIINAQFHKQAKYFNLKNLHM